MKMVFSSFFISKYIINGNKNEPKIKQLFSCITCYYTTSNKSNCNTHLL